MGRFALDQRRKDVVVRILVDSGDATGPTALEVLLLVVVDLLGTRLGRKAPRPVAVGGCPRDQTRQPNDHGGLKSCACAPSY